MEHMNFSSVLSLLSFWAKYTYDKVKHRSCISYR